VTRATWNERWRVLVRAGHRVDLGDGRAALLDDGWERITCEAPLDLPQGTAPPPGYELVGRRIVRTVLRARADGALVAETRVTRVYEIEAGGPLRDPRRLRPRRR
jgi:hypothetical protein